MSETLIRVSEEMTFYLSSLVSLDDILFPSYIESYPSKKKNLNEVISNTVPDHCYTPLC